jgi:hypothetical protein
MNSSRVESEKGDKSAIALARPQKIGKNNMGILKFNV